MPDELLKLVTEPLVGLARIAYVVIGLTVSVPVNVVDTAVFSLVLIDSLLAVGVTLSTTEMDTVAGALEAVPSEVSNVKLSAP